MGDIIAVEGEGDCVGDACYDKGLSLHTEDMAELINKIYWRPDETYPLAKPDDQGRTGRERFVAAYVDMAREGIIKSSQYDEQYWGSQPEYLRKDKKRSTSTLTWGQHEVGNPYFHESEAKYHANDLLKSLEYKWQVLYGEHVLPPSILPELSQGGPGTDKTSRQLETSLSTHKTLSPSFVATKKVFRSME